ncbi:MAG TPA: FAD-dependent oxidoreductase, partial [Bryobacteraceae bacterium]|nr:FAD-dependent oxidoreductase [Bryobacteraceae bacterium]
ETLGSSILFTSRLHHRAMPFTPPKWARKVTKEHLRFRRIDSWEYGYWWIEWGGNLSTIRDNEPIRFELLSIAMGVWDYIKNSGEYPSSARWALDWIGMMPGKRGSRRLVGDHLVTEHDLMRGTFPDGVAIGGWPMDDHPPGGFDRPDLPPNTVLKSNQVFNIPFRALYSRNIGNLMMAGRNISTTHAAFTSTRVMATCAVVGQAAGTAAAMCCKYKVTPRQLYRDRIGELQQALLRDDQTIRDVTNRDESDLARKARVDASCGDASKLLDGYTRDIPETREVHQWNTKLGPEGAWVELRWDRPQKISEVQITFDTGFQRQLTLSGSDATNRTVIRAPQPETVKDYRVMYARCGEWKELARVTGNFQRLNRHRAAPVETDAVRIHVTATNGDELARIFEVRCYA